MKWSVVRHDTEMRRFYRRLREPSRKPDNVSVVAVMRKILCI